MGPDRQPEDREKGGKRDGGLPLGVLVVLGSGSGFLRRPDRGYEPDRDDIYVGAKVIKRLGLRTGDDIHGDVGNRPRNGKSRPLVHVTQVNGRPPEEARDRPDFARMAAVHPDERLVLECGRTIGGAPDLTNRVIDLFCPLGKGQRAMIVSPAKAGKTTVLQAVAQGVVTNHPECSVFILLVDERPEEITEMEAFGFGEVIASSFDRPAERHVAVAELTLERARRVVESGGDAVVILDSITRLARAYNNVEKGTGRTLTGGLDAQSLDKPKRLLGAARKTDERHGGGSLTIVATALVDTGSRMDDVIFEEFKGTGNSELVLSRALSERRIFPAIDLTASATRKEERLLSEPALSISHALRRQLSSLDPQEAMRQLLDAMGRAATNRDFIASVANKVGMD
jgi:transcription termination factor Rho